MTLAALRSTAIYEPDPECTTCEGDQFTYERPDYLPVPCPDCTFVPSVIDLTLQPAETPR